jgi:hypothetical protein
VESENIRYLVMLGITKPLVALLILAVGLIVWVKMLHSIDNN